MKSTFKNKQLPKQVGVFVNITGDHIPNFKYFDIKNGRTEEGKKIMDIGTIENIIKKFIKYSESVTFFWIGKNLLSSNKDFYQKVIGLEKKYSVGTETEVKNKLESNADLIDDEIVTFLSKERFDITISVDSLVKIKELVKQAWYTERAASKIEPSLKKTQNYQNPEVLFLVDKQNSYDAENIYQALKEKRVKRVKLQFYQGSDLNLMLDNKQFYEFHKKTYDLWINDSEPVGIVLPLNNIVQGFLNRGERLFTSNCFERNLSIDVMGNIYPCPILGVEEFKFGNINTSSLEEVFYSEKRASLLNNYTKQKNSCENGCGYFLVCQGGCIKENFLNGKKLFLKNYFCSGKRKLFSYIANDLEQRLKPFLAEQRMAKGEQEL